METLIFDYNEVFKGPRAQDMREFLELRFRVFVQGLGWSLPSRDGMESDQYDNPNCTYILVKRSGRVVAGARIIPSCQDWFGQTNLLRDAAKGRITSIAPDLFPSDYDFADSYECSRLSVDVDQLSKPRGRPGVQASRASVCPGGSRTRVSDLSIPFPARPST